MSVNVKLSEETVEVAKKQAKAFNRTIGGQVDFWVKVGRLGESYPELSFHSLLDLMRRNKLEELSSVIKKNKNFSTISLDTRNYRFDRDEANAR
jgi:hypothetical protein